MLNVMTMFHICVTAYTPTCCVVPLASRPLTADVILITVDVDGGPSLPHGLTHNRMTAVGTPSGKTNGAYRYASASAVLSSHVDDSMGGGLRTPSRSHLKILLRSSSITTSCSCRKRRCHEITRRVPTSCGLVEQSLLRPRTQESNTVWWSRLLYILCSCIWPCYWNVMIAR